MTTLYLIRHGETQWNADARFQGHQNVSLNDTGREQASRVAAVLTATPFAAIYTSDLTRAAETAEIIAVNRPCRPIMDPRLREAHFGDWEGMSMTEVTARWPELVAAWRQDSLRTRPPGGEDLAHVQERVAAAVMDIIHRHPDDQVAIVGHGGSGRAVITLALGADLSLFRRLRIDNCSISEITVRDGQFTLTRLNDICHLGPRQPRATWDEVGDQWRTALAPAADNQR